MHSLVNLFLEYQGDLNGTLLCVCGCCVCVCVCVYIWWQVHSTTSQINTSQEMSHKMELAMVIWLCWLWSHTGNRSTCQHGLSRRWCTI